LGLGAWIFFSTFASPSPADGQTEFFNTFFRSLIVFFLMVNTIREPIDFAMVRDTVIISVGGLALISLYQSGILSGETLDGERLKAIGILENSNDIAAIMVMALPMALVPLVERRSGPFSSIFGLCFGGLTLVALWQSQSRGALLALVIIGATWFALKTRHPKRVIAIVLIGTFLASPLINQVMRRGAEDLEQSQESRITYWKAGLKMAMKNPLLGVGFGRYPYEFESYAEGDIFEWGHRTAHSSWVLLLAEAGVPALLILLFFLYRVYRGAWSVIKVQSDLFYALLGYTIVISFLSHTYLLYPYILFALVLCAANIYRPRPPQLDESIAGATAP
jgi:O-antigen ligase